jgi:hypothetical protein
MLQSEVWYFATSRCHVKNAPVPALSGYTYMTHCIISELFNFLVNSNYQNRHISYQPLLKLLSKLAQAYI